MELSLLAEIGIGASFGLSSLGSAIGMSINGPAAIGAWKKCYVQKKPAPFILLVFASTCLSNVIYGFITMQALANSTNPALTDFRILVLGIGAGICIGVVAITQAMCSACAADAYAETGQGFGNFLMVVGVAETISLFVMVFTMLYA
jgi:V/A-type H+-transporting ATPase subunit K